MDQELGSDLEKKLSALRKRLGGIKLTAAEKSAILQRLNHFVVSRPPSSYFWLFRPRLAGVFVLLAAVVVTSFTSFAAGGALPGDWLYPVKVNVNEKAKSLLALSPEKEAAWQTELFNRRLLEAETLAASGRLDESAKQEVETRLVKHVARAQVVIGQLEATGNKEAAARVVSNLNTAIEIHQKKLVSLVNEEKAPFENSEKLVDILDKVVETRVGVVQPAGQATSSVADSQPARETEQPQSVIETPVPDNKSTLNLNFDQLKASVVSPIKPSPAAVVEIKTPPR